MAIKNIKNEFISSRRRDGEGGVVPQNFRTPFSIDINNKKDKIVW